jgi:hypothetical protein
VAARNELPTTNYEPRTESPPSAFRRYHEANVGRDGHFPDTVRFSRYGAFFSKRRGFLDNALYARQRKKGTLAGSACLISAFVRFDLEV